MRRGYRRGPEHGNHFLQQLNEQGGQRPPCWLFFRDDQHIDRAPFPAEPQAVSRQLVQDHPHLRAPGIPQGCCVLKNIIFVKKRKAMEKAGLLYYLSTIKDPRRLQGQRHNLSLILLLMLMSIMSGYIGYRAIGDFIKRNREDLLAVLKPNKGRLPSFDVVRQVLIRIDFEEVSRAFHSWALQYITISEQEWVSIDGKAIGGTVMGGNTINQTFVSLVSLFCSRSGLILCNAQLSNSKDSEIPVVKQLIAALDLEGLTFTLDALHCQKKRQRSLSRAIITT
jgi:hypothetical protein